MFCLLNTNFVLQFSITLYNNLLLGVVGTGNSSELTPSQTRRLRLGRVSDTFNTWQMSLPSSFLILIPLSPGITHLGHDRFGGVNWIIPGPLLVLSQNRFTGLLDLKVIDVHQLWKHFITKALLGCWNTKNL